MFNIGVVAHVRHSHDIVDEPHCRRSFSDRTMRGVERVAASSKDICGAAGQHSQNVRIPAEGKKNASEHNCHIQQQKCERLHVASMDERERLSKVLEHF